MDGYDVFTRLRVAFTSEQNKQQTWKLKHNGDVFFWSFPPQ